MKNLLTETWGTIRAVCFIVRTFFVKWFLPIHGEEDEPDEDDGLFSKAASEIKKPRGQRTPDSIWGDLIDDSDDAVEKPAEQPLPKPEAIEPPQNAPSPDPKPIDGPVD